MFTNKTAPLAEFDGKYGLQVVRDCRLAFVGKIPTDLEPRVVPCGTGDHVRAAMAEPGIAGIITTEEAAEQVPPHMGLATAADPTDAAWRLHEELASRPDFQWKGFPSRIDPTAIIHPAAVIAPRDVMIGANTVVEPGAHIKERSIIGANCHIGDGVVVGLDAFEIFETARPRRILKQSGGVKIEDGVTILSKCTIVRATFGGFTTIGEGTMIDVLIHVAHDCRIGKRVTLVACCEISGRCVLEDDSYVGPNACLRNGIRVGKGATVSMGAVATRDVPDHATVTGNFAVDHGKWVNFVKNL